jgi:hypothetical protein
MNMKRLCLTLILTFLLTTSAFAGEMEGGEFAPPSAPATAPTQGSGTATTDTSSATTGDAVSAADVSATEGALGLVGAVLALF